MSSTITFQFNREKHLLHFDGPSMSVKETKQKIIKLLNLRGCNIIMTNKDTGIG